MWFTDIQGRPNIKEEARLHTLSLTSGTNANIRILNIGYVHIAQDFGLAYGLYN